MSVCKGYLGVYGMHNNVLWNVGQSAAFLVEVNVRVSGKGFVYYYAHQDNKKPALTGVQRPTPTMFL